MRPDQAGSPSRTSVSLSGDVAVANRYGGLTKVYARPESCVESNGMPGIQTSTDSNFLPWGVEECIAWYTPMNYISQRPVAWTQGTFNQDSCLWENHKVWTTGANEMIGVDVLLVNGTTGVVEAYAEEGEPAFTGTKCTPVVPNPGVAGDPCKVEGGWWTGVDNCDYGTGLQGRIFARGGAGVRSVPVQQHVRSGPAMPGPGGRDRVRSGRRMSLCDLSDPQCNGEGAECLPFHVIGGEAPPEHADVGLCELPG